MSMNGKFKLSMTILKIQIKQTLLLGGKKTLCTIRRQKERKKKVIYTQIVFGSEYCVKNGNKE